MNIFIGADHRGYATKEMLKKWLLDFGHTIVDCGNTHIDTNDDFPDFAFAVGDQVIKNRGSMGIVVCGSGGGVVIAANKVKGIRCVPANDVEDIVHNRKHNNVNMLAIGSTHTSYEVAQKAITAFLETAYNPEERFVRRLQKIQDRENFV